ncbi:hypothetical protein EVJ58_g4628 [Rhodofomes roseus]|uniref:Uncharacterized protein n=1 Tax=Rhodofomes roseus TaxID=34475 RepID=A0A4Y9YGV9_9APHY|nr:hypothetical protein EVJ58_g4628 [Rhodofomes roseus]
MHTLSRVLGRIRPLFVVRTFIAALVTVAVVVLVTALATTAVAVLGVALATASVAILILVIIMFRYGAP